MIRWNVEVLAMKYAVLLPAVLVSGLAAGCTDDTLSMPITKFVPITQSTCTADPAAATSMSGGVLDVGLVNANMLAGYVAAPVVQNGLSPVTMTTATGQVPDVSRQNIFVNGFDVQLEPDPNDAALNAALPPGIRSYEVAAAGGLLMPGATAAIPVEIIRADIARAMAQSIQPGTTDDLPLTVKVRAFGDHAGLRINGGFASFPVRICSFCLSQAFTACPAGGFKPNQILNGSPCDPQQDAPTTCCFNTMNQLVCGSSVPTM
jgi:hypothetical protein